MQTRILLSLCLVATLVGSSQADSPGFLKTMFGRSSADADASKSYVLSEEDGPWLILASTFVGEGSKARAERLVLELRKEFGLPAFLYKENFDFTGTINRDPRTAKATRYANQYSYEAYAVLVGEYDSVSHPAIERDLKRIRSARPTVFQDPKELAAETSRQNPVTTVKAITAKIFQGRSDEGRGPMSQAFVTRNPKLPQEFFSAPQIDSFVHEMNEGLHYSLLQCDGKYTVVVKTFEGLGAIVDDQGDKEFQPSTARMNKFAADAEKMTLELRKQGVEAYQYHDRFRSLVTVGSFDDLGRELPDGRFEYAPQIRAVMREYSAFNVHPELARQIPQGARGIASKNVAMIPFDVEPRPIAVPKPSKRSLYGTALGMR